jgi:hypothetical protein
MRDMSRNQPQPAVGSSISDLPGPLRDLGVRDGTLPDADREALLRDGFLVLPGHLPAEALAELRAAHDRAMARKYHDERGNLDGVSDHWHHERGTRRLADLVSEAPIVDRLYVDPVLLAAAHALIGGPFKLDSINARTAMPGAGAQGLHRDRPLAADGGCQAVNSAWLLDPFTAENGPTRVVPGTHRRPDGPDRLADPHARHPDERLVLAPAGSVIVFSCHLWHSGTINRSPAPRRVVHVSFERRDADHGERAQRLLIRKSTWERISPAARWVLDVCGAGERPRPS